MLMSMMMSSVYIGSASDCKLVGQLCKLFLLVFPPFLLQLLESLVVFDHSLWSCL